MIRKKHQVIFIIAACVFAIIVSFSVLMGVLYAKDRNKICKGVMICGENFSRLTKEEYEQKIQTITDKLMEKSVRFSYEKDTSEISLKDLKYELETSPTYEEAYAIGRNHSFLTNGAYKVAALFGRKTEVSPVAKIDKEACKKTLQKVVEDTKGKVQEHEITIEEDQIVIRPGHKGLAVKGDYEKETLQAISNSSFCVDVMLTTRYPQEINMESLAKEVYRDPADATCNVEGKSMTIVPAVVGRKLDTTMAKEKLSQLKEGGDPIILPLLLTQPNISTAQFKAALFSNTLASASSIYNVRQSDRSVNVELAARKINGILIAPGKIFSYNKSVGPRTEANGFRNAQIYVNNAIEMGMGGGICQVSSTLYNAVLKADLTVTQRKAHSLPINYVPLGQDATVSYGSVDFCFKNDTDYPIKVSASASGGKININLIGTQQGGKKEVVITNITKETLDFKTEHVNDATLAEGKTKVIQRGKKGYVIDTYKKVYQNGALISNKFIHRSRYNATNEKIAVGTAKAAASSSTAKPAAASPSPSPSATPESTTVPTTQTQPEPTAEVSTE